MMAYNKIFLIFSASIILIVVCLNISLDIHRVFGVDCCNKVFVDENLRFTKADYLKSHQNYTAFIFGSSRANFYSARLASKLSGFNFYNFNCPAEKLDRILQKLLWLKRNEVQLDEVVIFLDFDFMFLADDLLDSAIVTKEHPDVSGESQVNFYIPYIFQFDWKGWKKFVKVRSGHKSHENIKLDLETGNWVYPKKDEQISRDPEKYLKEQFPHEIPYERGNNRVPINLERLKAVISFLDSEHIPRKIVINPYYSETFMSFKEEEYRRWLKEVVAICGEVWDFSGLNAITQNPYLYYDSSHFRYPIGDMVLQKILQKHLYLESSMNGFGVILNDQTYK